jgi:hypothetical protein
MGDRYVAICPSAIKLGYDAKDKKWHASMDAKADQLKAALEFKYPRPADARLDKRASVVDWNSAVLFCCHFAPKSTRTNGAAAHPFGGGPFNGDSGTTLWLHGEQEFSQRALKLRGR